MSWCKKSAVGGVVAVNNGRGRWFGGGRAGRFVREVQPRPFPRLLGQHDSSHSAALEASERLGIDSAYMKTVSAKLLWWGDVISMVFVSDGLYRE